MNETTGMISCNGFVNRRASFLYTAGIYTPWLAFIRRSIKTLYPTKSVSNESPLGARLNVPTSLITRGRLLETKRAARLFGCLFRDKRDGPFNQIRRK